MLDAVGLAKAVASLTREPEKAGPNQFIGLVAISKVESPFLI